MDPDNLPWLFSQIYTQVSIKKFKEIHTLTHPLKARRTRTIDWEKSLRRPKIIYWRLLAAEATDEENQH